MSKSQLASVWLPAVPSLYNFTRFITCDNNFCTHVALRLSANSHGLSLWTLSQKVQKRTRLPGEYGDRTWVPILARSPLSLRLSRDGFAHALKPVLL